MFDKSLSMAEFVRQGATQAENLVPSAFRLNLSLSARGAIVRPVDVARALTRAGVSLGKAHKALVAVTEGASPTVEIDGRRLDQVLAELDELGVEASRFKEPERLDPGTRAPAA